MDLVVGGNSVCCLIIFVIFIGLGRAYRLGGDFEVNIWGERLARRARLDEMVKNGAGKSLYFMQLFLHYVLFGENFIA